MFIGKNNKIWDLTSRNVDLRDSINRRLELKRGSNKKLRVNIRKQLDLTNKSCDFNNKHGANGEIKRIYNLNLLEGGHHLWIQCYSI